VQVLLVEDDDADADLIRESLAELNGAVQVDRVSRVQAALARLGALQVDVILLDLTLPDAAGLDGLRLIRAAAPTVALVALTATADQRVGQQALFEGAQDVLPKESIDGPSLDRALRQARERQAFRDRTLELGEEKARRAAAESAQARAVWLAQENARLYGAEQEAVRVREELLSCASHELRATLATLRRQIKLMQREHQLEAVSRKNLPEGLRKLEAASLQLERLISALLDPSQIDSGQLNLFRVPADLVEVARLAIEGFHAKAAEARCELTLSGDATASGSFDLLRMGQVFTNLITNALQHGAGKPVHVNVSQPEQDVNITVSDGGTGVDEPGLGLYVTRRIVEAHGGTIGVASRAGAGSTFTLSLPNAPRAS